MADIKIAGRIKAGAADGISGYASEILFDDAASNKTVKEKLEGKQDTLTFDNVPTANSNNPVKSGGVYQAIQSIDVSSQISGKADKSEMSVVAGTGANADKTTITLKSGTSATVLTQHQDISGKQNVITDLATIRSGAAAGAEAAVRPYNTQSPDGMGYLVLDKEATFASQVTTANTIYEIRYDYDLNGQTVTLPANCVLKFNGGRLTNGTINGDVNVEGEYLSTLNAQVFVGGINFNLYQNDASINTSFIGMIPNDSTAATYNANLLLKIINSGKNVIVDNIYYIDHTNSIPLSRELVISGITDNAELIFTSSYTNRKVFEMNAGSSLKLRSLSLISNTFSYLILNQNVDYLINSIVIQNCKFEASWRIQFTGADIDYSQTEFGIKEFVFTNNTVRNTNSFIQLTDSVISDRFVISDNVITGMLYTFCNIGTSNNKTYSNENLKTYTAPLYVERNKVFGGTCETTGYNTFLLAEVNTVYYRYNHIENVLNVGSGISYDAYVSSINYYSEYNYFKNIATIPKSGTEKATADEIGKSKAIGEIRYFNNNIWIQDYSEIKDILSASYSEYSSMESSVFESLSYVSIFRYTDAQKKVVFTNNVISINAGKLKNLTSTTESLGIVRIENNVFDCSIQGPIIAPRNNTFVYIENNDFTQPSSSYYVYTGTYTLDVLCVKGNVFRGPYGLGTSNVQKSNKVEISDNMFVGNLDYATPLHLPNSIGNDGYVETKVSPTVNAKGIYFFNKCKSVIYFSTVSRVLVVPPTDSTYAKHTVLYNNVVLTEFYTKKSGDVCNVYDKNLIFEKEITSNYTTYYTDNNISVQIMKSCSIVLNKVNGTYCEVRSEVLQAFPQKTFPTGVTANRPANVAIGYQYFDTTLGKPIYWNGSTWVDEKGYTATINKGTTDQRPTSNLLADDAGFIYFDTTLGKSIYFNGTGWVDATGTAV